MKKELFLESALACKAVYKSYFDLGTTEFTVSIIEIDGEHIQMIAIAGTNEKKDWIKNLDLRSKCGIKIDAYNSAFKILGYCKANKLINSRMPILVTGHSKAGPTAIAYHRLIKKYYPAFASKWCVVFAPARALRYWANRKMNNTFVFTDPDDPVSFFGRISFGHPKCKHFKAENNNFGFKVDDHDIDHWVRYCAKMKKDLDYMSNI